MTANLWKMSVCKVLEELTEGISAEVVDPRIVPLDRISHQLSQENESRSATTPQNQWLYR